MDERMKQELQIVTLEQAIQLKRVDFTWEVDRYYSLVTDFHNQMEKGGLYKGSCINNEPDIVSAPLVALALKWFRNEKRIDSWIVRDGDYYKGYYGANIDGKTFSFTISEYKTYEEAEGCLLDKLIEAELHG